MINAHIRNKILHLTLTALPHYLTKGAVKINVSYIFFKEKLQSISLRPVTQNKSYTVTVSECTLG